MVRGLMLVLAVPGVVMFGPAHAARAQSPARDTTPGYPISDTLIVRACVGCHTRDSTGRISRVSYMRKSPEGWEMSIRRMITLNQARFDAAAARAVVRYLSDHQGLAPAELRPARFEVERRMVDFRYTADPKTEETCRACHSIARAMTQRRTKEEWDLLVATHRGLYPNADFQAFRRGGPPPDSGDASHPMDHAVAHLSKAFPLSTPEWTAWAATMRPPHLEGTWIVSGNESGRGPVFGTVTITRAATDGEFTTQSNLRYARSGATVSRTGRSLVYTGYQWRGRSAAASDTAPWREVLMVEPGWQEMSGRWYTGAYDELGADVTLRRSNGGTMVAGVWPRSVRTGATTEVTVFGANLPAGAPGLDFGPGTQVEGVVRANGEAITVRVRAAADAALGVRDLFVGGASLPGALVVYDQVKRLRVTPAAGMARVGGANFPKQLQQFEAVAVWDGGDGKPDTADDLELGAVDVAWSLEEYGTTFDDDDLRYVGTLGADGLFTPNVDGPNTARAGSRNNIGDVWVVATYTPPGGQKALKARGHLLVTVPLYMRWDGPGVGAGIRP